MFKFTASIIVFNNTSKEIDRIMKQKKLILLSIVLFAFSFKLCAQTQKDFYAERRLELMDSLNSDFALLFADAERGMNKNFFYLTGLESPGAVLLLLPGEKVQEVLFSKEGIWDYVNNNSSAAVHKLAELMRHLVPYLKGKEIGAVSFTELASLAKLRRLTAQATTLIDINPWIIDKRIIKSEAEIEFLRTACEITAQCLNDAFQEAEPGMTEKELAVVMTNGIKKRQSPGESFLQCASGPNATNVHFGASERKMETGDMIVFDVGATWNNYTADISRTIPVSGSFSPEQKEIYLLVLQAQKAAIKLMLPSKKMSEAKDAAEQVLIDGLFDLGLILDKNSEWQQRYFIQHGFYHFIGLDIHDVWYDFIQFGEEQKVYRPGMIMTMEPGLYFPEKMLDKRKPRGVEQEEWDSFTAKIGPIYAKYINIGVRIEDDILITKNGNEVLTSSVPKEINNIEKMMK